MSIHPLFMPGGVESGSVKKRNGPHPDGEVRIVKTTVPREDGDRFRQVIRCELHNIAQSPDRSLVRTQARSLRTLPK